MNLPNCPYFHYDAFRGREVMRCRLLARAQQHDRWSLKLCGRCPVPSTVQETNCQDLLLEIEVADRFFGMFPYVRITFAACGEAKQVLAEPKHCPSCTQPSF